MYFHMFNTVCRWLLFIEIKNTNYKLHYNPHRHFFKAFTQITIFGMCPGWIISAAQQDKVLARVFVQTREIYSWHCPWGWQWLVREKECFHIVASVAHLKNYWHGKSEFHGSDPLSVVPFFPKTCTSDTWYTSVLLNYGKRFHCSLLGIL